MAYTTDPVADLLTRIRNANSAYHDSLEISSSKLKLEIVKILQPFLLRARAFRRSRSLLPSSFGTQKSNRDFGIRATEQLP